MIKFDRERTIAIAVLAVLLVVCLIAPILSLKARSDSLQELADAQDTLARLQTAHRHAGGKDGKHEAVEAAPETAFLNGQTMGLAGAQLEAYLSQLASAEHTSLVSSGVQQPGHSEEKDIVRIQATMDISYDGLHTLLYKLETGIPYVFVDGLTLQPPSEAARHGGRDSVIKASLNLRALWRQAAP